MNYDVVEEIPDYVSNSFMECGISVKTEIWNKLLRIKSSNFENATMACYDFNAKFLNAMDDLDGIHKI